MTRIVILWDLKTLISRPSPFKLIKFLKPYHFRASSSLPSRHSKKMVTESNPVSEQTPVVDEQVDSLLEAARYGDLDDIKILESAGISLDSKDAQNRTALHMAAANGHLEVVDYLTSKGVDINAANEEKNTPLHWACLNGHIEVAKKLVLAGANVSALNSHDHVPIDEALSRGKMDVLDAINGVLAELELAQATVS